MICFSLTLTACSQGQPTSQMNPNGKQLTEDNHKKEIHWSYSGSTGPSNWGKLSENYSLCSKGKKQSPIDINNAIPQSLSSITMNYHPSKFTVINNGHTIQANSNDQKNKLLINRDQYVLQQFHFHTPSEHTFNGQSEALEVHLVHKNEKGNLTVLAVLIQAGDEHKTLSQIMRNLPKNERETFIVNDFDVSTIIPTKKAQYHYTGSLTTPPCSEEVQWIIMESPIELSEQEITTFKQLFKSNRRPVQPLHDRTVYIDSDL